MPPKPTARHQSINPLKNEYIPPVYLPNLRKYKYSGTDFSILTQYVLQPYWNFVVNLVPMTIAPNRITFTGFLIGMSSAAFLVYFYFFEGGVYPSWSLYYAAFALFTYQTLDAIDGKQARRTGTCSPLGELFDHGCDAFLTPFVLLSVSLATYMDPVERFWLLVISSMSLFTVIWEQFSTGTFELGYISGPSEGIILNCVLFILSAMYGESIWDASAVGPYDVAYPAALSWLFPGCNGTLHIESIRSVLFLLFVILCPFTMVVNVLHMALRPTVHTSKVAPVLAVVPILAITALMVHVFVVFPNVTVRFPFVMELSYSLLMSITVTRLTLARLSIMPYRTVNWHFILLFIALSTASAMHYAAEASASHELVETVLGWTLTGLSVLAAMQYGHMITSALTQMARYLSISIMNIKPSKSD
ncbi:aminoalcoholphosphotransferase, putative [Leishmania tarentolae]|uniref:Aminoalcoholphosphotransferase, putative n=1 Tax=Leishmania tarentolae TaxID=5689 RepID=A0A640L1K5_LEITA|nr:aminoalcoholphosphotransferase, putative [Leishmania tarentolae]